MVVAFAQVLKVSDSVTGLGITGGESPRGPDVLAAAAHGPLNPGQRLVRHAARGGAPGRRPRDRRLVGAGGQSPYRLLRVPFWMGVGAGLRLGLASAHRRRAVGRPGPAQSHVPERPARFWPAACAAASSSSGSPTSPSSPRDARARSSRTSSSPSRRNPTQPLLISARRGAVVGGERARDLVFELTDGAVLLEDQEEQRYRLIRFERARAPPRRRQARGQQGADLDAGAGGKNLATLFEESRGIPTSKKRRARPAEHHHPAPEAGAAPRHHHLRAARRAGWPAAPPAGRAGPGAFYSAGIVGGFLLPRTRRGAPGPERPLRPGAGGVGPEPHRHRGVRGDARSAREARGMSRLRTARAP